MALGANIDVPIVTVWPSALCTGGSWLTANRKDGFPLSRPVTPPMSHLCEGTADRHCAVHKAICRFTLPSGKSHDGDPSRTPSLAVFHCRPVTYRFPLMGTTFTPHWHLPMSIDAVFQGQTWSLTLVRGGILMWRPPCCQFRPYPHDFTSEERQRHCFVAIA